MIGMLIGKTTLPLRFHKPGTMSSDRRLSQTVHSLMTLFLVEEMGNQESKVPGTAVAGAELNLAESVTVE